MTTLKKGDLVTSANGFTRKVMIMPYCIKK